MAEIEGSDKRTVDEATMMIELGTTTFLESTVLEAGCVAARVVDDVLFAVWQSSQSFENND